MPDYNKLGVVNAISFVDSDGRFPKLEEIDYPLLPFTTVTMLYSYAFKKMVSKILCDLQIAINNGNMTPENVALLCANVVPWQIYTNTSRQIVLTGNKVNLPIFYGSVYAAQTTTIYEDTLKFQKSSSGAGTPVVGMTVSRTFFISLKAGTIGTNATLYQSIALAYALPVGTCIVWVGSYTNIANIATAQGAGVPPFTKLYILSATYSAPNVLYTFSLTPGGSPVTLSATVAADLSLNFRTNMSIINVTSDASFWYVVLNMSSFNYSSSSNNSLMAITGSPIDPDKMLLMNRGLVY
jgi:hypothetical protein